MKAFFTLLLVVAIPALLSAQDIPMADTMRSEGKIYVLVAIILTILLGLFVYLFMMDKKVSKLEKDVKS